MGWVRYNYHARPAGHNNNPTFFLLLSVCLGICLALVAGHKVSDSNVQKSGPPLRNFNAKCNPLAYPTAFCAPAPADAIYIMFQHSRIQLQKNELGHKVTEDSDAGLRH